MGSAAGRTGDLAGRVLVTMLPHGTSNAGRLSASPRGGFRAAAPKTSTSSRIGLRTPTLQCRHTWLASSWGRDFLGCGGLLVTPPRTSRRCNFALFRPRKGYYPCPVRPRGGPLAEPVRSTLQEELSSGSVHGEGRSEGGNWAGRRLRTADLQDLGCAECFGPADWIRAPKSAHGNHTTWRLSWASS